jgi:hypothetical protein
MKLKNAIGGNRKSMSTCGRQGRFAWVDPVRLGCIGFLILAFSGTSGILADSSSDTMLGSDAVVRSSTEAGFYDDPGADYPDDGSQNLRGSSAERAPEGLIPISPVEESGLLGDWGDSDDEAED